MPHDPTIFAPWPEREAFQKALTRIYRRREITEQLTEIKAENEPTTTLDPLTIAAAEHWGFTVDLRTGRMTNQHGEDVTIT